MIEVFDLSRATDLDKQKLPIQTINGKAPDSSGAVEIDVGVKTVNGVSPDASGNVSLFSAYGAQRDRATNKPNYGLT